MIPLQLQSQVFTATAAAVDGVATAMSNYTVSDEFTTQEGSSFRLALSGIFGSISIACWVVLLVPQLIDQWRLKSSEGVSLLFLIAWFLGDLANLMGALWAHLLRDVVLLAVWFVFADAIEVSSAIYYRFVYNPHPHHSLDALESDGLPESPIDGDEFTSDDVPLLSNNLNTSASHEFADPDVDAMPTISSAPKSNQNFVLKYVAPIIGVCIAGFFGYVFGGSSDDSEIDNGQDLDQPLSLGPQILGYTSALLYLSARIPQIIQNHQRRSVHGLSLLFFIYSTMGNVTYAAQIILYSSDRRYILLNLSWLLGSLGTVFQDAIIFAQFYIYREKVQNLRLSQVLSEVNDTSI